MNQSPDIVLKPIGVVRSPIKEVTDDCWGGVAATIALDSQLFGPESTQGLDQFSHLEVIFLLNKIPADSVEKRRAASARTHRLAENGNLRAALSRPA